MAESETGAKLETCTGVTTEGQQWSSWRLPAAVADQREPVRGLACIMCIIETAEFCQTAFEDKHLRRYSRLQILLIVHNRARCNEVDGVYDVSPAIEAEMGRNRGLFNRGLKGILKTSIASKSSLGW
jgi:hypothetical protein